MSAVLSPTTATPDLAAVKTRQQAAWSTGNYAVVGTTLQIVGEQLCEALDPRAGWRVLDVAAGNGNATLAAARRGCTVTSTDYVPSLLDAGKLRAQAEGHDIAFQEADAEKLPFADASFDAVINVEASHCYPDFPRFLAEVARVLRPGGHFLYADFRFNEGLADWEQALAGAPLKQVGTRVINAEVLRGMDLNSARSQALLVRHLPAWMQSLGRDFAGIRGSRIYNALKEDHLSYRSYCFAKDLAPAAGAGLSPT